MNTGDKVCVTFFFCLVVVILSMFLISEYWKNQIMRRQIEVQAEAVKAAERVFMEWGK